MSLRITVPKKPKPDLMVGVAGKHALRRLFKNPQVKRVVACSSAV